MERPGVESEVLSFLRSMTADPSAVASYEYLTGGLVWSDEVPADEQGRRTVWRSLAFRMAIAYRASLTIGEERAEFRPLWQQIEQDAPSWPGLRPDRRGEAARRQLAERHKELDRWIEELDAAAKARG
jgi:hypothetical protein